ncbi:MAG: tetraacyldisaccharide 4'-kinase, partial [Bacteroidales bacterium]
MNILFRILLYPFSLLYGILAGLRNKLFDWHILPSKAVGVPVISVGNISAGGTGKTPHVEYLANLLKSEYTVGILSRGYRRKTRGFYLVDSNSDATTVGDEPMQFYQHFKEDAVITAVDENRVRGCRKLLQAHPGIGVILLDDAFQHRWIQRGLNILISDFFHPYHKDYLLPSGRLREFRSSSKRADIIVISKSGKVLSPITRRTLTEELKPSARQLLCFSYMKYKTPRPLPVVQHTPKWGKTYAILMVTGIANPYPLEGKIAQECFELHKLKYPDHHKFTPKDARKIKDTFDKIVSVNEIIITTEKDAMRLSTPEIIKIIGHLPIFY